MHPATIFLDLRDRGFLLSLQGGKLFCSPIKTLPPADRDLLLEHRAALVAWLAAGPDDTARAEAIAARAAADNPFDNPARGPTVLVRAHDEGEAPEYLALDGCFLRELDGWCAVMRKGRAEKDAQREKRGRARAGRAKGEGPELFGGPS